MSNKTKRYLLPEEEIPHYWYNIQADMANKPMPPLHPGTKQKTFFPYLQKNSHVRS